MNNNDLHFFFGASSGDGFVSFFSDSYRYDGEWMAYIIKGGPGTGKSTLMKRVANHAAEKSLHVELGHCSSDPDSLDVVVIPEIKTVLLDGTSPHVVEPRYPGACEQIVDLSSCWDVHLLHSRAEQIENIADECTRFHNQARRYLKSAGSFRSRNKEIVRTFVDKDKIHSYARHVISTLRLKNGTGHFHNRFMSAVTHGGVCSFAEHNMSEYSKFIFFEDHTGDFASMLFDELCSMLSEKECTAYICPCSQDKGVTEHILIPTCSAMITTVNRYHSVSAGRKIHTSRFTKKALSSETKKELCENEKDQAAFIDRASSSIKNAKETHDKLEEIYIQAMDFGKVGMITDNLIKEIFR